MNYYSDLTDISNNLIKKSNTIKHRFINYLQDKCNNSKITNNTLGIYIRGLHISAPFFFLMMNIYASKYISILIIILLFIALLLFYLFNGCFLTILERRLCGDTFTFIDPILEYYNYEMTNYNRYVVSFKVAIIYITIMLSITYLKL